MKFDLAKYGPFLRLVLPAICLGVSAPVVAQSEVDRTISDTEQDASIEASNDFLTEADGPVRIAQAVRRAGPPVASGDQGFVISSILISGNAAMPDGEFVDLIESYTSRNLSQNDLSTLADAIAQRARDAGFVFATATIPQQSLSMGILRVELDEGKVDAIQIEGADDPAIHRQLTPLVNGKPVTRSELERRILLADDISGVRILDSRYEKEGDTGILIVRTRRSHASAAVELRNNGSEPVGPIRARIRVDLNGVLNSADEVDVTLGTTPLQPDELQFASASYRIVVDSSGLELGTHLSFSSTEPGAFLADRDIDGRFWRAGINAQYPLLRRRGMSVWVVGEFEVSELEQERAGELVRRDRVPVISAGLYSRGRLAGGNYRGRVMVSRGLSILSATQLGDPLATRGDASADFTSLFGWFAWDRALSENLTLSLGGRGQLASDPLLATEDIGLGGTSFLRGYNFNERSGDQGIMGYGELRYDWRGKGFWLPRAQVYVFADGGVVSNLQNGFGDGSLASAGGGMRLDITRDLDLDLEVAVPLSGTRFDSDSDAPLLNIRVEQSF